MSEVQQYVRLLSYTPDAEKLAAMAAKLCYSPSGIDDIEDGLTPEGASAYIEKIVNVGHLSTVEHASFTFGIEGVSRTLLAQITRHRIASFSVQSQRYVNFSQNGFSYIVPPSVKALGCEAVEKFEGQMNTLQRWYDEWRITLGEKGEESNEDARFVLPGACETKMIMTMNARELMHFFSLRCCNRAQWEIRELAWSMFALVCDVAPALFSASGPACVRGKCSEGAMTCGLSAEVKQKQTNIGKGR